jgi:hypothetical protein
MALVLPCRGHVHVERGGQDVRVAEVGRTRAPIRRALGGRREGLAGRPWLRKREKLKDFHDTFEDEFEDFDEVHESDHESDGR